MLRIIFPQYILTTYKSITSVLRTHIPNSIKMFITINYLVFPSRGPVYTRFITPGWDFESYRMKNSINTSNLFIIKRLRWKLDVSWKTCAKNKWIPLPASNNIAYSNFKLFIETNEYRWWCSHFKVLIYESVLCE